MMGTAKETTKALSSVGVLDDPELPERIRAADSDALRAVVRAYLGQILRATRNAGLAPELAEEVAQKTFTTFIEKAEKFEGKSHVRTWLFGILYKKIAEARRQMQRTVQMDDIDELVAQRFDSKGSWVRPPRAVDEQLYSAEIGKLIEDCLEVVPHPQRMAFILREVEGFETDEMCKILGVTRTNLGVILYRVRNRLRECLETKGVSGDIHAEL